MSPVIRWTAEPVFRDPPVQVQTQADQSEGIQEWTRRVISLSVASLALLLTSPFFLLIAGAVKLSSPGPVFFRQERVGHNRRSKPVDRRVRTRGNTDRRGADSGGDLFPMYKFRTMYVDHDKTTRQVWAKKDDPRITPVGRVLRAFRMDELPQLWNVLLGHMNIVGPRPEQPKIFLELRTEIAEYSQRQRVLPGITGWAQINNGYDQTFKDVERKLGYDLEYLNRRSLGEDFRIMAKTIPVVLNRKGYH
jgi:lipopolysaccharide/colanic/teichoic acid biosynthesis glycosyltransferase